MGKERYDFCGYATKNDLLCSDGRVIRKDAFKDCDGVTVPLVWNHRHDDPEMVLGHALLQNRKDGVFMYGKFNDTEKGNACKKILENRDITGLSIFANQLKQNAGNVLHGVIQEVSLVLKGANPGALIDFSLAHSSDGSDGEMYAFLVGDEFTELKHGDDIEYEEEQEETEVVKEAVLSHADEKPEETKENKKAASEDDSEETVEDVFNTLNEKQKTAVYALMAAVASDEDEDEDDNEEDEDEGESKTMKHNAFDNDVRSNTLSQADMDTIFRDAKRLGSLKEAIHEHEENGVLAHAISEPDDWGIQRGSAPQSNPQTNRYGIYEPSMLFPEFRSINNVPDFIKRDTSWVADFMNGVKHTPFSRIKSIHADITAEDARALGYIKGNLKKEEFFTLIKRTTDPQTIYKKQKMDRDDIVDITGFDVIAWIRGEMRMMLEEELARACLIGDGRNNSSSDKIAENHIRPIAKDSDLYAVKVPVEVASAPEVTAKNFVKACIRARKDYRGSGNPVLYTTEDMLTEMLLIEDGMSHFLFPSVENLATTLRVKKIVAVPVMENVTIPIVTTEGSTSTTSDQELFGIIVNLQDYVIGADKGGAINMFDDFDIDYNQEKYLIETRCSGALVKPYSALVLHSAVE